MNSDASVWLNDIAVAWASWMLGMAWIVVALVAALIFITNVLRNRPASLLYALWLLVLVRLLLPPDFAFPTGWGWWFRSEPLAASLPAPASAPVQGNLLHATEGSPLASGSDKPEATVASTTLPIALILMIAWMGIVAARCGMLLTAALQVHVWVSRAHPILDPAFLELLDECRDRVGVRRRVELRNSESCSTPLVVGIWHPVLLLPAAVLDRLNTAQLQSVLIHELHHVRRWDGMVNLLQGLLGAIYFFHPAVWWANRRIRQLREDACDERTVAVLEGNRKPYGEAIVRVAEILGYSAPPLTLGVLDSTSPLTQRMQRILDPRLPITQVHPWRSAAVLLVASAILLPAGARPSVSAANSLNEGRVVAEAFSRSPLGNVENERVPSPASGRQAAQDVLSPDRAATEEAPEAEPRVDRDPTAELVHDLVTASRRRAAVDSLIAIGSDAETEVLGRLPMADPPTRAAMYEVLTVIGTERSLLPLQQTLLARNGLEERQIRHALDAIYDRMVVPIFTREPSTNSSRIYELDDNDDQTELFLAPGD